MNLQDFFYRIRDTLSDLWNSVTSYLPYSVREKLVYALPIGTASVSAIAIVVCIQANANAASINDQAVSYQQGQFQLASTLGQEEEADLGEEAEEIMGRSDLVLQYTDLASLEGENAFEQMERMANVSEGAEEQAAEDANSAVYDSIYDYAGDFGGALIRNEDGSGNVLLAAYENESDMEAPEDSEVSNVLVKQVRRTIEAENYGERDTTNTLTILSGNDINNFSLIKEGSVMYLLLGRSSGSKSSQMYICTGIEPGSLEGSSTGIDESSSESSSEEETETIGLSAGTRRGTYLMALSSTGSSASRSSDGTVTYSDGTKVEADGTVTYSDGTVVSPDGTVTYPDGMTISPDGTISGASRGQSSSDSSDSSDEGNSSEGSSSTGSDTESGDSGDTGTAEEPADAELPEVRTGGGILVENDREHDVVLYSINSRTGSVTITYWDAAAES